MLKKILLGTAATAFLLLGAAGPAHAARGTVDLFDNANFDWSAGGLSTSAEVGECVTLEPYMKNRVSSVRTNRTVILFDGDGCAAPSLTVTQSSSYVGWMNDRTNSFKII
ncbi:hypothetical protein AB5J62_38020 [Amycolatopsis sp. cg5]|uniref:hypothetical protein n=1 Tax=Amycolatopsis sp. cg5 TaxID=3238802 RepID=UPI0035237F9F